MPEGFSVVKKDEVTFTVPGVSKVAGAQVLREEYRRRLLLHQPAQGGGGERLALAGGGGEAEIHTQPLHVQCQSAAPLSCGLPQPFRKISTGDGGADQGDRVFRPLRIPLRKVEGTAAGDLIQPPDKGLAIRTGRFLKVQENALVVSPPALPKYSRTKGFRIVDHRGLPVTDGQKAALGLQQKVLPQQNGAFPNAIGHMGQRTAVFCRSLRLTRGYGQIDLQTTLPLVFTVSICYTEENYAEGEHPMPFSLIPGRLFAHYREVTPEYLKKQEITLLLSDLDFTLAPKSVRSPDAELRAWIAALRAEGISLMIVSNNRSGRRVTEFCADLGVPYQGRAGKPSTRGLEAAMARSGADRAHTAMLGDKLLTDMLAANRCGVLALMVEPLGGAVTPWQKVLHALQAPFKAVCRRRVEKSRGKKPTNG